ncbi:unnamed protein product [Rhizophagus irregularis]|nr:unnamed protein product [Rhizophagus irregularis]
MQDIAVDLAFILLKVKNTPHLIISTIIFFILPTNRLSLETTRMDFMNYKRSLDWRNFWNLDLGERSLFKVD